MKNGCFLGMGVLASVLSAACLSVVPDGSRMAGAGNLQRVLLSACEETNGITPGGWRADRLDVSATGPEIAPKLGSAAVRLSAVGQIAGAKGDFQVAADVGGEARLLGMWVCLPDGANVERVGMQMKDGEDEVLFSLIPANWTGWKWVEIDLAGGELAQAYPQEGKNKKFDGGLKNLSVIWFTKAPGPSAIVVDGITAAITADPNAKGALAASLSANSAVEPGLPLAAQLMITNTAAQPAAATVEYSVQVDSAFYSRPAPDPVWGTDHALGAKSWTIAEGRTIEEGSLTDGDDFTTAETEYKSNYWEEAFQYIDLGKERRITYFTHQAGDANWIWKVDVAASSDGKEYTPVTGLQGLDWYKKWGLQRHPLPEPVTARYLRFRYHNNGAKMNVFRMPLGIAVYDGVEDETMEIPQVGKVVAGGRQQVNVAARDFAAVTLSGKAPLGPGAYFVAARVESGGKTFLTHRHLFVMPPVLEKVDENSRFALNTSTAGLGQKHRRLGIGWVRFENMKWPFVSPEPGVYKFDGTVKPWVVNHDAIFEDYNKNDLSILPYLFMTPRYQQPAAAPDAGKGFTYPPNDFEKYGEFVFQTVARYGKQKHPESALLTSDKKSGLGWIHTYELWNEPNLDNPDWGHWKGPISGYYECYRIGAEAARRADPSVKIANAGYAGITLDLVGQLATYKYKDGKCPLDFTDVLSVHHYTGQIPPEVATVDTNRDRAGTKVGQRTFEEDLQRLTAWRDEHKPGMPIWFTETGYDTGGPRGVSERVQAAWMVRDVMISLAAGMDKVFIYRETGSKDVLYGASGVIRDDGSFKPSWFSFATLIRQLDGAGEGKRLVVPDPNARVYAWKAGDKTIVAAWAVEGEARATLNLGDCAITDAFGHASKGPVGGEQRLSIFPVYYRDINPTQAAAIWETIGTQEAAEKKRLAELSALKAYLFDFGGPDQQIGSLDLGKERMFTPVAAEQVWDAAKGYGFTPGPAMENGEWRYLSNKLERDGVKMYTDVRFQFKAAPGTYVLKLKAAPFAATGKMTLRGLDGADKTIDFNKNDTVEMTVKVGAEPVSIAVGQYTNLLWLTLIEKK